MSILAYDINQLVTSYSSNIRHPDAVKDYSAPMVVVNRSRDDERRFVWEVYINHSSSSSGCYGQESIDAARNMSRMLLDLADTAADIMKRQDEMRAAYDAHMREEQARFEREQAERQAKLDADTRLSSREIGHLIATMAVDVKHGGKYRVTRDIRIRGSERTVRLVATSTMGGAVQFKLSGDVYSKAKLAEKLLNYAQVMPVDE